VNAERVIYDRVGSLAVMYSDDGYSTEDRPPILRMLTTSGRNFSVQPAGAGDAPHRRDH
jgi:hypothetical protein